MAQNALELYKRIKNDPDLQGQTYSLDDAGNLYDASGKMLGGQPQPKEQGFTRATFAPLVEYPDGRVEFGLPNILAAPLEGLQNFGRYGYDSPEAISDNARSAFDVAGSVGLGNIVATPLKPTGLGMFGGRLAKTADQNALKRAEEMFINNVPKEQIWSETGWFQGPDGKWRFEIDDSKAKVSPEAYKQFSQSRENSERPLNALMQHDKMFEAYPEAANQPIRREVNDGSGYTSPLAFEYMGLGTPKYYAYKDRPNALTSTILHELQHGIQSKEGFEPGGVSDYFEQGRRLAHLLKTDEYPGQGYRRLAGEVEARAVQDRQKLSAEERRARPPWLDYDVSEIDQIFQNK